MQLSNDYNVRARPSEPRKRRRIDDLAPLKATHVVLHAAASAAVQAAPLLPSTENLAQPPVSQLQPVISLQGETLLPGAARLALAAVLRQGQPPRSAAGQLQSMQRSALAPFLRGADAALTTVSGPVQTRPRAAADMQTRIWLCTMGVILYIHTNILAWLRQVCALP